MDAIGKAKDALERISWDDQGLSEIMYNVGLAQAHAAIAQAQATAAQTEQLKRIADALYATPNSLSVADLLNSIDDALEAAHELATNPYR